MDKQHYKKLSIEFPIQEYTYLKLACAKQGVTLKDFVTRSIIKTIEDYENALDLLALEQITEDERKNAISWEQAQKELRWNK